MTPGSIAGADRSGHRRSAADAGDYRPGCRQGRGPARAPAAQQLRDQTAKVADLARIDELLTAAQRLDAAAPHQLRHSLARRLLTQGAQLPEVQRILGHSRLSTTGMYLTPSEDELRGAIERMQI